jgi:hypothetical protein
MAKFTYWHGDKAQYTGKVEVLHGGTFYEAIFVEGHRKGATILVAAPPKH